MPEEAVHRAGDGPRGGHDGAPDGVRGPFLDVEGTRLVIDAYWLEDASGDGSAEAEAEVRRIVESLDLDAGP